ncbi:sulfate ABC transporter substrate-binding protein [Neorhizobium galegae]|uniref:sulfate ABC transporter substrate-binding protein n=1 Tax=Neorhizobium galegae TaxID=399 RepID=UPI0006221ED0|nr:sulfate ABC transporter substrate-binding protein [Neorhizobium galegae]MCQ1764449.1 sulfate ABC transporter substrate-binding protein [Neorhizobium galegae]MCQ1845846.1 sulfate ABC transporter substrate-binding protein [Neorhizobium galegae]CDZ40818.1 Sulfate ABC transporter, periplasmic sulfate-binding protein [Neorhizobium galegae bv. officinalis]
MFNFAPGLGRRLGARLGALALGLSLTTGISVGIAAPAFAQTQLLNVSYDPTRELYKEFNVAFAKYWKAQGGDDVTIRQSHGGSGAQARSVIDGLEADVVTLALESDINAIEKSGKIKAGWRDRLPNHASPYTSTIVFLVRKGNPKGIKNWGDLVKGDIQIVTPNPKTSGGARWNYLAAWAWANEEFKGDQAKIKAYVGELYKRAPVLDTGARGSTVTFAQRQIGDVLLAWENEAYLAGAEFGKDAFEIVVPPISILAEPPVAVVDATVDSKGTRKQAEAYLQYLYSDEGQNIAAKHFYRPSKPDVVKPELLKALPNIKLVTIDDPIFGGWKKAQPEHFGDGGIFDQIYKPGK